MSVRVNASNEGLVRTASLPSATSFTIAGWFIKRGIGATDWRSIAGIADSGGNAWQMLYEVAAGDNNVRIHGLFGDASLAIVLSTDVWYYFAIGCNGTGSTGLTGWIITEGGTVYTASTTGVSLTPAEIGLLSNNVWGEWVNGSVANAMVWNTKLTTADLLTQRLNTDPVVATGSLYSWAPLTVHTDLGDYSGNSRPWTSLGGTLSTEETPPLLIPGDISLDAVAYNTSYLDITVISNDLIALDAVSHTTSYPDAELVSPPEPIALDAASYSLVFGDAILVTENYSPTTASSTAEAPWSDDNWVNPENIYGAGVASITAPTFDNGDQSYILRAQGFSGLSAIPSDATIDGIVVKIRARFVVGSANIDLVRLLDANGALVGDNKAAAPQTLTNTLTEYSFGGTSDTWNLTLTGADLQDVDFGVGMGMIAASNNTDVEVDYITISVYYTESSNVSLDPVTYGLTVNDITTVENDLVLLDSTSVAVTVNELSLLSNDLVTLDAESIGLSFFDITVISNDLIALDAVAYNTSYLDITTVSFDIVPLDLIAITSGFNDVTVTSNEVVLLDPESISLSFFDLSVVSNDLIALDDWLFNTSYLDITILSFDLVPLDLVVVSSEFDDVNVISSEAVPLDLETISSSFPDISIVSNDLTSMDAVSYNTTYLDITVLSFDIVPLDLTNVTTVFNDISVLSSEAIGLDDVSYTSIFGDLTIISDDIVPVDFVPLSLTYNDITVSGNEAILLDAATSTSLINDLIITSNDPISLESIDYVYTISDISTISNDLILLELFEYSSSYDTALLVSDDVIMLDLYSEETQYGYSYLVTSAITETPVSRLYVVDEGIRYHMVPLDNRYDSVDEDIRLYSMKKGE